MVTTKYIAPWTKQKTELNIPAEPIFIANWVGESFYFDSLWTIHLRPADKSSPVYPEFPLIPGTAVAQTRVILTSDS